MLNVTAGRSNVRSWPPNLPLACKPMVVIPKGPATAELTVSFPSEAFSAMVSAATVRPGGRGNAVIASAASAPLDARHLDRNRRAQAVGDLE